MGLMNRLIRAWRALFGDAISEEQLMEAANDRLQRDLVGRLMREHAEYSRDLANILTGYEMLGQRLRLIEQTQMMAAENDRLQKETADLRKETADLRHENNSIALAKFSRDLANILSGYDLVGQRLWNLDEKLGGTLRAGHKLAVAEIGEKRDRNDGPPDYGLGPGVPP